MMMVWLKAFWKCLDHGLSKLKNANEVLVLLAVGLCLTGSLEFVQTKFKCK
jgi:hypothetical protein